MAPTYLRPERAMPLRVNCWVNNELPCPGVSEQASGALSVAWRPAPGQAGHGRGRSTRLDGLGIVLSALTNERWGETGTWR